VTGNRGYLHGVQALPKEPGCRLLPEIVKDKTHLKAEDLAELLK